MSEKRCKKCGEVKSLDAFRKEKLGVQGRQARCRSCKRRKEQEQIAARGESYAAQKRRWREENPEAARFAQVRYAAANREKREAKQIAWNAIRRGDLVRPDHCSECGSSAIPEAHHFDYSRPLDVTWLCHRCHRGTHAKV